MLFDTLVAFIAIVGLALAQLPNLPACSLVCFVNALGEDGCPGLTNFTCHCGVSTLVGDITPCVKRACDLSDQSSVSNAVTSICSSVGVPVSVPPVGAASASASASASATTTAPSASSPITASAAQSTTTATTSVHTLCIPTNPLSSFSPAECTDLPIPCNSSLVSCPIGVAPSNQTASGGIVTGNSTTTTRTSATLSTVVPESTGGATPDSVSYIGTGIFAAVGIAFLFVVY